MNRVAQSIPAGVPAIRTEGLSVRFGDFTAVDGVDLTLEAGKVLGLLGPNGAGKTTTVRALATLQRISGGSAQIFGHDVASDGVGVRALIGLTGQYASVDEDLSARENLMIFARLQGFSRADARRRCAEVLDEFSLSHVATKQIKNFSGGMRRRLDLAASLIAEPPLIFLDEPTTGLDPRTRVQMWETVRRLVRQGSTVLLTTQYLDEADELADHIAVIDHGRVVAEGTADELKREVAANSVRLVAEDAAQLPALADVVRRVLQAADDEVHIEPRQRLVSAPVSSTTVVADILIELRDAGIELDELTVQKPSLDDVFFALTGHPAQTDETPDTEIDDAPEHEDVNAR